MPSFVVNDYIKFFLTQYCFYHLHIGDIGILHHLQTRNCLNSVCTATVHIQICRTLRVVCQLDFLLVIFSLVPSFSFSSS